MPQPQLTRLAKPEKAHWEQSKEVTNLIRFEGNQIVSDYLGDWTLFEYDDAPQPTIRLFVPSDGRPAITLTKNSNGTLRATSDPKIAASMAPEDYANAKFNLMLAASTKHLLDWAAHRLPHINLPYTVLQWDEYSQQPKDIRAAVGLSVRTALSSHRMNGKLHRTGHSAAWKKLRPLIKTKIVDQEIASLAARYQPIPQHWLRQYNHVARNLGTYRTMNHESPKVLAAWCRLFGNCPQERMKNPGHATHRVKTELALPPVQWRLFTKTGLKRQGDQVLEPTKLALEAVTQANCPQAPMPVKRLMLQETASHDFFKNSAWLRGDPWQAWLHLIAETLRDSAQNPAKYCYGHPPSDEAIARFLIQEGPEPSNHEYSEGYKEFRKSRDALRHHVGNEQPWPRSNLEAYHRRSETWHTQQQETRAQRETERLNSITWESHVGRTTLANGIIAVPVTNALELTLLGQEMQNCLSAFVNSAANGQTKIFKLISQKGKLLSALELTGHSGAWSLTQHEGPKHTKPPDEALLAGIELAQLYRKAVQT